MKKIITALMLLCFLTACTPVPSETVPSEQLASAQPTQDMPNPSPAPVFIDLGSVELMETIHINQLGYRTGDAKRAVIPADEAPFTVARVSDGAAVFIGDASDPIQSPASGETVRVADFSELIEPGEYVLCTGEGKSHPFILADDPYPGLRAAVLEMFHYQKCGVDLEAGIWSHTACHTGLAAVLDTDGNKTGEQKDVSGGWHDAGDYGRYIVPAAKTVADLLLAYEFAPNPDPELLDVVWHEIQWMLTMQDEATGGVHHKVSCKSFNALDQMPQDEKGELVLCPISMTATADFAATMAMASRFYPDQKDTLLAAAKRAWDWCVANPDAPGFKNPPGVSTGEYGDGNSKDERFWAACELFAATGEEVYHNAIKAGDIYSGLGWADMGTFGLIAYLFHGGDAADSTLTMRMKNKLLAECQEIIKRVENDPYGVSLGLNYVWGSNMTVANDAMLLLFGSHFNENAKAAYLEAAQEQMHYLLGKNALSQSYITGFGSNAPQNPHHRPSVAKGSAVPGMVIGGPNKNTGNDPALKRDCEGQPPMKCFTDDKDSYASNEITIYWNSPVYFVLAVLGL